ncbi:MAG: efflux RND transporter periplasmic adaptor subunit [Alphaproteobacteria bacterium]
MTFDNHHPSGHQPQEDDPDQNNSHYNDEYGYDDGYDNGGYPPPKNPMQKYIIIGISLVIVALVGWWLLGAGHGVVVAGKKHDEKMGGGATNDIITNGTANQLDNNNTPAVAKLSTGEKTIPDILAVDLTAVDYQPTLLATGISVPIKQTIIKSAVGGRIQRKIAKENKPIKNGNGILKFETAASRAQLIAAQKQLQLLKITRNSEKELATQGLSSNLNMAKAEADLASTRAQVAELRRVLRELNVKAPFSGVVTNYYVEVGDYVSPGEPLADFSALQQLYVNIYVSAEKAQNLKLGAEATVTMLGITKKAVVDYVGVISDQQTRTIKIRLKMDNSDGKLKGQIPAEVSIALPKVKAYKIPPTALSLSDDGGVGIKTLGNDNRVIFIPITILAQDANNVWASGLPEKITLLTDGQAFVSSGQSINPIYKK